MKNYKSKWKEPSPPSLDSRLAATGLILLETQVPSALCLGRDVPLGWGGERRGSRSACPALDRHAAATWEERGRRPEGNPDAVLLPRCLRLLLLTCSGLPTDVVRMVTLRGLSPKGIPRRPCRRWSRAAPHRGIPPGVGTPVALLPPPKEQCLLWAPGPSQRGQ